LSLYRNSAPNDNNKVFKLRLISITQTEMHVHAKFCASITNRAMQLAEP